MSSNFTVNRLCEQCGNVFVAKTTVTRFCSKLCNKRNFKARNRGEKMAAMDQVVKKVLEGTAPDLSAMEFLSVKAASKLLGASERIIYGMIACGKLNAINLSKRKTVVFRKDIDKLFEIPKPKIMKEETPSFSECYHMAEAQKLFNISEKALYDIIKRNHIPKYQDGAFTYVGKSDINKILNPADHA